MATDGSPVHRTTRFRLTRCLGRLSPGDSGDSHQCDDPPHARPVAPSSSREAGEPITFPMDTLSIALSGLQSADQRLDVAAHNVANLATDDVRPLEVVQQERSTGGSIARIDQAASPRPVEYIHEAVELLRASYQFKASLRMLAVEYDLRGQITDALA